MSEGEKDVPTEIVLRSGYAVEAPDGPGGDMLQLRAPDGRLCLNSPRMLPRIEAALPATPPGEREGQGG